jgi:hypothetical protein
MAMDAPRLEYLMGLKAKLDTPSADRGALVGAASQTLRCSVQTVYRHLREVGWESGRKTRADRGRISVPEDLARAAAGLVKVATRAHGKRTMTITGACDILGGNGYGVVNPKTGEVAMPSPTTVSRAMSIYGCHPDQLERGTPAQELRSLHPNHVWQIDASVCVLFYLPRGKVRVIDEKKYYKNKPANLEKLQRDMVNLVDEQSSCLRSSGQFHNNALLSPERKKPLRGDTQPQSEIAAEALRGGSSGVADAGRRKGGVEGILASP